MKKYISIGAIVLIGLIATVYSPFASAQTATTVLKCTSVKANLTTLLGKVEASTKTQTTIYQEQQKNIETLLTSSKTMSYDTTKLTSARDSVKTKVTTYIDKASAYATTLTTAKNIDCSSDMTAMQAALATVRSSVAAVRTATTDARTALRSEAIPAIKDYALWLKTNTTTTTENK